MNLGITPISFTGGQRIKVNIVDAVADYAKGFEMGSTLPKDEVEIHLRKAASSPKQKSFVQGLLDGMDSLKGLVKDPTKIKIKNPRGKY